MAEHIQAPSVDGMLEGMGSDELMEWMAWEKMNGVLGSQRDNILNANLCSLIANCNRDPKRTAYKYSDFLILPCPIAGANGGRKATSAEEQIAIFRAMARVLGGE